MIFGKTKLEMKVGIFVFVGIIILVTFVLLIGNFRSWTANYRVNFTFGFINGVKLGAPVRFAGVDIGEVKAIQFISAPKEGRIKVRVGVSIRKEVRVPLDSTVWVNTLGLLGERYIEIMPGKDYAKCLGENQEIAGTDPIPMHEVASLVKNIVDDIDKTVLKIKNGEGTIGRLLSDDSIYREIEAAIKYKDGTVGKFFYDDAVYKEVEALISDIRKNPWKLFIKTKEKK